MDYYFYDVPKHDIRRPLPTPPPVHQASWPGSLTETNSEGEGVEGQRGGQSVGWCRRRSSADHKKQKREDPSQTIFLHRAGPALDSQHLPRGEGQGAGAGGAAVGGGTVCGGAGFSVDVWQVHRRMRRCRTRDHRAAKCVCTRQPEGSTGRMDALRATRFFPLQRQEPAGGRVGRGRGLGSRERRVRAQL